MSIKTYEKALEQVKSLFQQEKFINALEVIDKQLEEKDTMPEEMIMRFEELRAQAELYTLTEEHLKTFSKCDKLTAQKQVFKDEINVVYFAFMAYLMIYADKLDEGDKKFFEKIFMSVKLSNQKKMLLIDVLRSFGYRENINFLNSAINKTFVFDFNKDYTFEANAFFMRIDKKLEETFYKNPSQLVIARDFLSVIHDQYIGCDVEKTAEWVANGIINYTNFLLRDECGNYSDFQNWFKGLTDATTLAELDKMD